MAHVISYPDDINQKSLEDPAFLKLKAEILFNGNKLLEKLQLQYDDCVTVLSDHQGNFMCIHNITCCICGSVVGGSRAYTDMHLELHIKNGE